MKIMAFIYVLPLNVPHISVMANGGGGAKIAHYRRALMALKSGLQGTLRCGMGMAPRLCEQQIFTQSLLSEHRSISERTAGHPFAIPLLLRIERTAKFVQSC